MLSNAIVSDPPAGQRRPSSPRPIGIVKFLLLTASLLVLSACATNPAERDAEQPGPPSPAAQLYQSASTALESEDYRAAIRGFQRLVVLHPDDRHATQARMELVYAYYRDGDPASADAAAGRFIRENPDHPNLDYLYYLRGLARYDQALDDLSEIEPDSIGRPASVDLALRYLNELIGRYPQSRYSSDARSRLAHLRRRLAQFELAAAKQSLNRGEYIDAGLRARAVIDHFPDSALATEAATVVNMANRMRNIETGELEQAVSSGTDDAGVPASQTTGAQPESGREWRREAWIRDQQANAWTLQLLGTADEQALQSFIETHGLEQAAYFESTGISSPWYSLIYGVFDDIDAARAAVEKLPREALGERPWIRKFGDVQAIITMERLENGEQE